MGETFGKILLMVLLILAATAWFANAKPIPVQAGSSMPISIGLNQYTAGAIAAERIPLPYFDQVGVVFIDTASTPGVPYLAFENDKDQLMTRELIFKQDGPDGRGCNASAGELPCVPEVNGGENPGGATSASDVSPIPSGTVAHITGGLESQAVIVTGYQENPSGLSQNMTRMSAVVGDSVKFSNGLNLNLRSVIDDARCTLFVGCFPNGTKRLEVTIGNGAATTTTDLVPGTIFAFGTSHILLLSLTDTTPQNIATFLIVAGR